MIQTPLRFAVGPDTPLPDLTDLAPVGGRWVTADAETVDSTYLDTADADLDRAGVTLSRWSTGAVAGWRLALPDRPERELIDKPGSAPKTPPPVTDPPADFTAAVRGACRGLDLIPVATVRTHRTLYRLLDAATSPLLELADETVHTSTSTPDGVLLTVWRRWEVIPVPDTPAPVAAVVGRLTAPDGSTRDDDPRSDLQRARPDPPASGHPRGPTPGKHGKHGKQGKHSKHGKHGKHSRHRTHGPTAGQVIRAYLIAQDDALIAGDLALRAAAVGVHPTRVATRRLRSTLRIFAPFLDADRAATLDGELSWYAAALGEVRDREVQRVRMRALIDGIPDDLVLGPVAASIDGALLAEETVHRGRLAEVLDSPRYLALLRDVRSWSSMPPFTARAAEPAKALRRRVRTAAAKLVAHLESGLRRGGGGDELHRARKAGKRARYAAELAAPVLGDKGTSLVQRYQEVQDVLGEHQDGVVACALIRRLAAGTLDRPRENGFTYGLLYAREQDRAAAYRERADQLYEALRT